MNGPADSRPISRRRTRSRNARGTTSVEMALVLLLFLTLVLGMLDLGIGVFRYNLLAQAARQGARQAIVHGTLADRLGPWGPQSYSGQGDDSHPVADAVRPSLTAFDPSEVGIQADWIDGDNEFEKRVRIAVSAPYRPIMTFIFGNPTFTLRGTSTMPIAH
ncbi:MAG TPA: TadE/TadG family type IV pilus assembly protein [Thermoguttaceae bacterium]|nr:TadE/TadG family type IV pilus assembly protein [Thermoguttaceae bacterium]